jgi:glucan phosphoethanolaminetransferase (alkaline phosphatase superfamily)
VADEKNSNGSGLAGTTTISNNYHIAVLLVLTAIMAFYTIFQYKKRLFQVKLCSFIYLLLSATLVTYYLAIKADNSLLTNADKGEFLVGFYAPVLGILFNFLAIRFIRKDEALVRSVDRLR